MGDTDVNHELPESPLLDLPADFVAFRRAGHTLVDPAGDDQLVGFRPLSELAVEPIPVEPGGWDYFTADPSEPVATTVPVVRLAGIHRTDYGAVHFLVWLPELRRYGVWDSADHCLQAFGPGVTWEHITRAPTRYLNPGPAGELRGQPCLLREPPARPSRGDPGAIRELRRWRRMGPGQRLLMGILTLAAVFLGYLHLTSPPPAVSPETFDKIALGMSESEVDKIVRAAPGFYDGHEKYFGTSGKGTRVLAGQTAEYQVRRRTLWGSRDGLLTVEYDVAGRVCGKRLEYRQDWQPSRPDKWSWWKRLWQRESPRSGPAIIYSPF